MLTRALAKAANEATLKALTQQCENAVFATMAEAVDGVDSPRPKVVKPHKTYDGLLTLGNPDSPTAMRIGVERYFKTHLARPQGASTVVVKAEQGADTLDGDGIDGADFSAVKQARTYRINDPDAPGGKRDVEFGSLAKGYEYGRTAVHISESDHNITRMETKKSFCIVGFIQRDRVPCLSGQRLPPRMLMFCHQYEPFLNMGEACVTHARKSDAESQIALSSLIWALSELESYAVARIVTKDDKEPLPVLLVPCLEPDLECLYDVPLPFAEDVRGYRFPPLDKVVTVSGQTRTRHPLLPSDELTEAMDDYVDAMDLSEMGNEYAAGTCTRHAAYRI